MQTLPSVGDVPCPKCDAASGTPCTYTYDVHRGKYPKAWRDLRKGSAMYAYHAERHAMFRNLRDNPDLHHAQLRMWLFLHSDIFKES